MTTPIVENEERLPHLSGVRHPAPHRRRVARWVIAIALFVAPVTWGLQLLVAVTLAGHACYPHAVPRALPLWANLSQRLLAMNIAAIALCLIAGFVAWLGWRRTRAERPGDAHHLLESGDGRTRFLAMAGLINSVLFGVAVIFESINLFMDPTCLA
jgi:hypothetical protein